MNAPFGVHSGGPVTTPIDAGLFIQEMYLEHIINRQKACGEINMITQVKRFCKQNLRPYLGLNNV